jgi:hypothetical protein
LRLWTLSGPLDSFWLSKDCPLWDK